MDLDLEDLVVAGDGSVNLVEHGEGVVELHVAGEGGEGVIGAAFNVGDLDRVFEDGDGFFEASEAAVDGGEDVEANGEVEVGLSLDGAALEGLGGPDGEVEGLRRPIARGNGVMGQPKRSGGVSRVFFLEEREGDVVGGFLGNGEGVLLLPSNLWDWLGEAVAAHCLL